VYPAGKQALPKVSAFVSFLARELPARLSLDRAPGQGAQPSHAPGSTARP
jgi:hypothetical protein